MKYIFENIGPIKKAEMELEDLTILAGQNNTGKSYLAYSVWYTQRSILEGHGLDGVLNQIKNQSNSNINEMFKNIQIPKTFTGSIRDLYKADSFSEGTVTIADIKQSNFSDLLQERSDEFNEKKNDERFFKDSALNLMSKFYDFYDDDTYNLFSYLIMQNKYFDNLSSNSIFRENLEQLCVQIFKRAYFPDKHYLLTTERSSSFLFDYDVKRSQGMKQYDYDNHLTEVFDYGFRLISNIGRFHQTTSDWYRNNPELENLFLTLLDGRLGYRKDEPFYVPAKKTDLEMEYRHLSSSVRSLAMFYYILKHFIKRGDLIVIDEPESYLNPKKQIQFARIIAFCINHGVKILITTHSDFIIREFETLMMLNHEFDGKTSFMKENSYLEGMILSPEKIKPYHTTINDDGTITLDKSQKSDMGMELIPIDKAIEAQDEIYTTLIHKLIKNEE